MKKQGQTVHKTATKRKTEKEANINTDIETKERTKQEIDRQKNTHKIVTQQDFTIMMFFLDHIFDVLCVQEVVTHRHYFLDI